MRARLGFEFRWEKTRGQARRQMPDSLQETASGVEPIRLAPITTNSASRRFLLNRRGARSRPLRLANAGEDTPGSSSSPTSWIREVGLTNLRIFRADTVLGCVGILDESILSPSFSGII